NRPLSSGQSERLLQSERRKLQWVSGGRNFRRATVFLLRVFKFVNGIIDVFSSGNVKMLNRITGKFAGASLIVCLCVATIGKAADDKGAKASESLPLQKLVMFNAGVGFFEHRGQVDGNAQGEVKVNNEEINHMLNSMVLQDPR